MPDRFEDDRFADDGSRREAEEGEHQFRVWNEGTHADDIEFGVQDDRENAGADAEREGRGVKREFAQRPTHVAIQPRGANPGSAATPNQ